MLIAAFAVLAAAVLIGAALAVRYLLSGKLARWPLAALHGLIGIAGLCCLLHALHGHPREPGHGTESFGAIAATLVALAALLGLGIQLMRRGRRQNAGTLIGLHATLAISGFVVLAAYLWA